jgi:hypothetical protein
MDTGIVLLLTIWKGSQWESDPMNGSTNHITDNLTDVKNSLEVSKIYVLATENLCENFKVIMVSFDKFSLIVCCILVSTSWEDLRSNRT